MAVAPQDDYVRYPKWTRTEDIGGTTPPHDARRENIYGLSTAELFWRDLQPYLLSHGFELRPRYHPDFAPWWYETDIDPMYIEEAQSDWRPNVIDARRQSDGMVVALKYIADPERAEQELAIMTFLSQPELVNDPRNHCTSLLGTLPHPSKGIFTITPWLYNFIDVPLRGVYEIVDMLDQLLEGLEFMHEHGVAHRDCTNHNIMQDASRLFAGRKTHPIAQSRSEDLLTYYMPSARTRTNIRYYFIDFGISSRHDGPGPHLVTGTDCRDDTVPELSVTEPYDPFRVDIYLLGNHFLTYAEKWKNLEFLRPLLNRMTSQNPSSRPTPSEARAALDQVSRAQPFFSRMWKLQRRNGLDFFAIQEDIHFFFGSLWENLSRLLF